MLDQSTTDKQPLIIRGPGGDQVDRYVQDGNELTHESCCRHSSTTRATSAPACTCDHDDSNIVLSDN